MFATGNKKMLNMLILDILEQYSDEDHHLTQQDIIRHLRAQYGMECDRRSVKNNIDALKELGYDIETNNKGAFLAGRKFDNAELRLMIDSVLFSKGISQKRAKDLIGKLKELGGRHFSAKVKHVCNLPELQHTDNKHTMYSLDALNDAIDKRRKVSFVYNSYGTDFQLHPRRKEPYIVNPYQIVANNGRYYLIANYDKYDNIAHFRIDRMTSVCMLDEKRKPVSQVTDFKNGFSLPRHMAEHIYMFSGKSVNVRMKAKKHLMNELVDWFGKDFKIRKEYEDEMLIDVKCNATAMYFWALQYGPYVEVLEPAELREEIKRSIAAMNEKYSDNQCV